VGDAFLKWVLTNRTNPKHCEQVRITQIAENDFAEFPRSQSLVGFDPSDRKFVAVALTHPQRPAIAAADHVKLVIRRMSKKNFARDHFCC
jgi:hypothetical protein